LKPEVKRSTIFSREKTDKTDAEIIAQYGYRFYDKINLWQQVRKILKKLQYITKLRERLIKVK